MKSKPQNKPFSEQYVVANRKSTDDAENQKNSLSYQRTTNIEFARKNNLPMATGLTISGFCKAGIIDESDSGFKEDADFTINSDGSVQYNIHRPKFLKLVTMLKNKELKGVVWLCWDRASRNKQDDIIIKKLIVLGSDIRFSQATYEKSSAGSLHMDIDSVFAGHYSLVISEKVKAAQQKLRAEGKCIYFSPIGYLDQGSGNKPFDPERCDIVKQIFELYSTGEWGFFQLGKWAREQGLTTKPVRRKRTKAEIANNVPLESIPKISRPADHKTIENILSNPFYIGKIKTAGGYINGNQQPLIGIGLYNKVQGILKQRRVSVYYLDKDFFVYRKLLYCKCDRCFSPYQKKGINYYRTRCEDACTNPDKNLTETDIHRLVTETLSKIHFTDQELKEIEAMAKTELGIIAQNRNNELNSLSAQRKKVFSDLDYLVNNKLTLLRTQTMKMDDIRDEDSRLTLKLAEIDAKIKAQSESAQEILNYVIAFSELVKTAAAYYKFALDIEKQEIITQVFTELIFDNRKLIKYTAKEGFEALLNRTWESGAPTLS